MQRPADVTDMIRLHAVTCSSTIAGSRAPLLSNADLDVAQGRYALLSRTPEAHRALIEVLAGLRRTRHGFVEHRGRVSWPLGRQGFIRGKANGLRMIEFVCALHGLPAKAAIELVADLITCPAHLELPMEHWPLATRQEVSFALALAPDFDVYVVDGALPHEASRFARLWRALFDERLVGRTLILSTYRRQQMADYCVKGLIYEGSSLRIDADLDECLRRFPPRRANGESVASADGNGLDAAPGGAFDV
ncbi:ATPase [Caballeronia sp. Sq4a]|uniref:ATPase n=2 Tax=unclassified Caballeronia TaxID=2646786 RepID=UPI00352CED6A